MKVRCKSCGGTYNTLKPGEVGLSYFHVCPPEIVDTPEVTHPDTHEVITQVKRKPTPNPRNENLKRHPDKPGEYVIISEGSGVTELE
jgi:hypothetical protein